MELLLISENKKIIDIITIQFSYFNSIIFNINMKLIKISFFKIISNSEGYSNLFISRYLNHTITIISQSYHIHIKFISQSQS